MTFYYLLVFWKCSVSGTSLPWGKNQASVGFICGIPSYARSWNFWACVLQWLWVLKFPNPVCLVLAVVWISHVPPQSPVLEQLFPACGIIWEDCVTLEGEVFLEKLVHLCRSEVLYLSLLPFDCVYNENTCLLPLPVYLPHHDRQCLLQYTFPPWWTVSLPVHLSYHMDCVPLFYSFLTMRNCASSCIPSPPWWTMSLPV